MDTFHKQVLNKGITYYPKTGYSVLELDENFYNCETSSLQLSEKDRIALLAKISTLDNEEQELIERYYFKSEKLIDIAREKVKTNCGDNRIMADVHYPISFSASDENGNGQNMITREHNRIRQKLHRAKEKLGNIIINEGELCSITK